MRIKEYQEEIKKLAAVKNWQLDDCYNRFNNLYSEVAEAWTAWKRSKKDLELEIADICSDTMLIAIAFNIDIEERLIHKVEINRRRIIEKDELGRKHKKEGDPVTEDELQKLILACDNFDELQKRVIANKENRGFTRDPEVEFMLMFGEVAEAADAWRRGKDDLGFELADVIIYLLGLTQTFGFSLDEILKKKIAINWKREWK
jgi:NTP pyrophosphatase (non-canonical NTP hydrolase)